MVVKLLKYPDDDDWMECKARALETVGMRPVTPPDHKWKHSILEARHSPIRHLMFAFEIECPYWVSTHLCRHIHAQPYVRSQRNDRQDEYDRNAARQDVTVRMIWDMNAEELMVIANKRMCNQAAVETRYVVREMCQQVIDVCPEFEGLLVPLCEYCGGVCHEMRSCGRYPKQKEVVPDN